MNQNDSKMLKKSIVCFVAKTLINEGHKNVTTPRVLPTLLDTCLDTCCCTAICAFHFNNLEEFTIGGEVFFVCGAVENCSKTKN